MRGDEDNDDAARVPATVAAVFPKSSGLRREGAQGGRPARRFGALAVAEVAGPGRGGGCHGRCSPWPEGRVRRRRRGRARVSSELRGRSRSCGEGEDEEKGGIQGQGQEVHDAACVE